MDTKVERQLMAVLYEAANRLPLVLVGVAAIARDQGLTLGQMYYIGGKWWANGWWYFNHGNSVGYFTEAGINHAMEVHHAEAQESVAPAALWTALGDVSR